MSWATDRVHQDLSSTGKYNSSSALAKEYAGLKKTAAVLMMVLAGVRLNAIAPKNAAEYAQLVKDYAAGFDVKAIDMDGDDFTNSNIAIKPSDGGGESSKMLSCPSSSYCPSTCCTI